MLVYSIRPLQGRTCINRLPSTDMSSRWDALSALGLLVSLSFLLDQNI